MKQMQLPLGVRSAPGNLELTGTCREFRQPFVFSFVFLRDESMLFLSPGGLGITCSMARSNIKEIMQKVSLVSKILVSKILFVRLKPPLGGEARRFLFCFVYARKVFARNWRQVSPCPCVLIVFSMLQISRRPHKESRHHFSRAVGA